MAKRTLLVFAVFGVALAACGNGSQAGEAAEGLPFLDPEEITIDEAPMPVAVGVETGVAEYFASLDWLSDPTLGPDGVVRDNFAGLLYPDENGTTQVGRHNQRGPWWRPRFIPSSDDPLFDLGVETTETHPVVNYDYTCADGRSAYVSHYVHEYDEFTKAWTRDDFLGTTSYDETDNRISFRRVGVDPANSDIGYLRTTGVGGPFAGAQYALTVGEDSRGETGYLSYGYYQYFSFTNEDGTEVEVQVTAPSFDFPDGWMDIDDNSPSILDGDADPFDLINHEQVQARFECGRELANRLAPVIAALNTSS